MSLAFSSSIWRALTGAHGFGLTRLDPIGGVERPGIGDADLLPLLPRPAPFRAGNMVRQQGPSRDHLARFISPTPDVQRAPVWRAS